MAEPNRRWSPSSKLHQACCSRRRALQQAANPNLLPIPYRGKSHVSQPQIHPVTISSQQICTWLRPSISRIPPLLNQLPIRTSMSRIFFRMFPMIFLCFSHIVPLCHIDLESFPSGISQPHFISSLRVIWHQMRWSELRSGPLRRSSAGFDEIGRWYGQIYDIDIDYDILWYAMLWYTDIL